MKVDGWGPEPTALGRQATVHHHTIVAHDRIVGLWEYEGERVLCGFFSEPPSGWKSAAEALETWIAAELGDVFIYAQDGALQRRRRSEAVRRLRRS